MLKPSMQELLKKVGNRYLLVNLAAQRARDISEEAEENSDILDEKSVKMALDEIVDGSIVYQEGPRVARVIPTVPSTDLSGTLDLDFEDAGEESPAADDLFEDEDE